MTVVPARQLQVGVAASLMLHRDALTRSLRAVPGWRVAEYHPARVPDVLVLDIATLTLHKVAELAREVPLLAWGGYLHHEQVRSLIADGLRGYVSVIGKRQELVRAVVNLAAGESHFPQLPDAPALRLTAAEDRVARAYLIDMAASSRADVAAALGLSERTVKAHLANVRKKLAGQPVNSRGSLLRALRAHGWPTGSDAETGEA